MLSMFGSRAFKISQLKISVIIQKRLIPHYDFTKLIKFGMSLLIILVSIVKYDLLILNWLLNII